MDNIKIIDSATNFYRWLIIKFDNIIFNINFCFKFFYCILYQFINKNSWIKSKRLRRTSLIRAPE